MYAVTIKNGATETPIHDKNNQLLSGSVAQGINTIDSFTFTTHPDNPAFGNLNDFETLVEVFNERKNRYEFRGRVLCSTPSMSESGLLTQEVICESFLGFLCDSQQEYVEEKSWLADELLRYLINVHNSKVEEYKRFHLIVAKNIASKSVYCGIQRENTWETIKKKLIDSIGGEITFDIVEGELTLFYYEKLGEEKTTSIALSKNMKSIVKEKDPTAFITRLIPLGAKLGDDTEKRLDIASVNNGIKYIDDDEAIAIYGIHEGYIEYDDVTEPENLIRKGREWLRNNNKVLIKYSITALDLSLIGLDIDDFEVHNYYPIKNPLLSIDDTARIIKKTVDICEVVKSTFEIGESFKTLSEIQREQMSSISKISADVGKIIADYVTNKELTIQLETLSTSIISQTENSILLKVSEGYISNTDFESYKETASASIETTANSILQQVSGTYSTKGELAGVSGAVNGLASDLDTLGKSVTQIRLDLNSIDLSVYAKGEDLAEYAKTSDLEGYATDADLAEYAKTTEVESKIALEIGKIDLSVYAKNTELAKTNENVAQLKLDLDSIDLSVYATKSDLGDYAKTQDVSSALSIYAKTEDLNSYAKAESLDDYATKEAVREAIAGIDLSVSATNSQLKTVEAQLNLAVLTDGEGNLESAIHIGADKLTIETGNFSLDSDGTMKAIQGEVAGWQITPNTIYKEASNIFTGISSINKYARATEGLVYALNAEGTGYEVTGYTGTDTVVYIPSEYNSLPVTAIGQFAFSGCNMTSITIPDSITKIGVNAFRNCAALASVTIPKSVTTMGIQTFSTTNLSLKIIYCEAESKPSGWNSLWNDSRATVTWGHTIYSSPRFFAGSKSNTPLTPDEADFLVFEDGTLFASKANINGVINAKSGYIGGWELGDMNLTYFQNSGLSSVESYEDSFAKRYKIHLTPKGLHLSQHYTGLSYRPEACLTWGAIFYLLWNAIKSANGSVQGVDYAKDEYFTWD